MCDILCELALQDILLLSGSLHSLIHLYNTLGYLAQFIIWEIGQIFHFQTLVVICLIGKDGKFGDVLAQPVGETIEHDGKKDDGNDGKPDIMLVCLKRLGQIVIIRQRRTHDELRFWKIGSHIEIILLQGLRLSFHTRALSHLQSLSYFLPFGMIGKMTIILAHIIEHHPTIGLDQGNTKVLALMFTHEFLQFSLSHTHAIHHINAIR